MSRPHSSYTIEALEVLARNDPKAVLAELQFRRSSRARRLMQSITSDNGRHKAVESSSDRGPSDSPQAVAHVIAPAYFVIPPVPRANTLTRLSNKLKSEYLASRDEVKRAVERLEVLDVSIPAAAKRLQELKRQAKNLKGIESLAYGTYCTRAIMSRRKTIALPPTNDFGLESVRCDARVSAAREFVEAQLILLSLQRELAETVRIREAAASRCSDILAIVQSQDEFDAAADRTREMFTHLARLQAQPNSRLIVLWRNRDRIEPLRAEAVRTLLRRRAGFGTDP